MFGETDMKATLANRTLTGLFAVGIALLICGPSTGAQTPPRDEVKAHKVHDPDRPMPPKVDPGPYAGPAAVPEDATLLFGGDDLSQWQQLDGQAAQWTVDDALMRIKPGTGDIQTRQTFGDAQLHVEWRTRPDAKVPSNTHSNSGVFFGQYYEVQVLATHEADVYADGMVGAIYGQYPPLVDAQRPNGQWQVYDILYDRPRFDDNGKMTEPTQLTVFFNGVLVQHHERLTGPTDHKKRPPYTAHGKLPIRLQDHGDVLWYRNIWIRELE
jgi:hypothetical protein